MTNLEVLRQELHDCYCMYDEKLKCDNGIATWLKQEYTGVSDYD